MVFDRSLISRSLSCAGLLLLVLAGGRALAQRGGASSSSNPVGHIDFGGSDNSPRQAPQRIIVGKVTDKDGKPAAGALVYVKDTKNSSIRVMSVDEQGAYRFGALSLADDYEVWAVQGSLKTSVKPVSSFIETGLVNIPLKLNPVAAPTLAPAAPKAASPPASASQSPSPK